MGTAILAKQAARIAQPEVSFTFALPAAQRRCHGLTASPSG
jgi:hypothetical protein